MESELDWVFVEKEREEGGLSRSVRPNQDQGHAVRRQDILNRRWTLKGAVLGYETSCLGVGVEVIWGHMHMTEDTIILLIEVE